MKPHCGRTLVACCLASVLVVISASALVPEPASTLTFEGTVSDAGGRAIPSGQVNVSCAGGAIGDFKTPFKAGLFRIQAELPAGSPLPLMVKLTFYADGQPFPPRWIEHLSPRLPPGAKQNLHVVLYTDDQLKKANRGEVFAEAQQLETSLLFWIQADKQFKAEHAHRFSRKLLDDRRKLIYRIWDEAAQKADFPKTYGDAIRRRFADDGDLDRAMKDHLPNDI